jgi:hypothetical protein
MKTSKIIIILGKGDKMEKLSKELNTKGRQHIKETNFAIPKDHEKNNSNEGHYPIHDRAHAQNAVARVMQQDKVPCWWSGSLSELKNTVKRKAHGKFKPKTIEKKSMDMGAKEIIVRLANLSDSLDEIGDYDNSSGLTDVMRNLKINPNFIGNNNWVPANGGEEKPFRVRGRVLQYVVNPRTGDHAYYDVVNDIILDDKEASEIFFD